MKIFQEKVDPFFFLFIYCFYLVFSKKERIWQEGFRVKSAFSYPFSFFLRLAGIRLFSAFARIVRYVFLKVNLTMSAYKNSKSQMTTVRIPHDVIEGMAAARRNGESNAAFIVHAVRGELARRQSEGLINPLVNSLNALKRVEEISAEAGEAIRKIASIAATERQRRERREKCGK